MAQPPYEGQPEEEPGQPPAPDGQQPEAPSPSGPDAAAPMPPEPGSDPPSPSGPNDASWAAPPHAAQPPNFAPPPGHAEAYPPAGPGPGVPPSGPQPPYPGPQPPTGGQPGYAPPPSTGAQPSYAEGGGPGGPGYPPPPPGQGPAPYGPPREPGQPQFAVPPSGPPPGGPPPGGPPPGGAYGAPPPNPYQVPQSQGSKRMPLILGIVGGVVVLAVVAVGVVWFVMRGGGLHEVTPQCDELEVSAMSELVPDAELQRDEFSEEEFWDELRCEWQSSASTSGAPGYASVFLMRNDGSDPIGITENDLDNEIAQHSGVSEEADIGDEAYSWYDEESSVGCVATRTDNIFVRTCYDAAVDFLDPQSIDSEAAIDAARQMSTEMVSTLQDRL